MTLPITIIDWLHARGITDAVLTANSIDWNGTHIIIPIYDPAGNFLFNKYRRDPFGPTDAPKYKYEAGSTAHLFNAHKLDQKHSVIICEGEMDALRLESAGYIAVTSTGGAGTFKDEWLPLLAGKDLYVSYDNDEAGLKGATKLLTKLPAKMVLIPRAEGVKDITDYLKIGGSFPILLEQAQAFPFLSEPTPEFKDTKGVEAHIKKIKNHLKDIMEQEHDAKQTNKPFRHLDMVKELLITAIYNLNREIRRFRHSGKTAEMPDNDDGRITDEDIARAKEIPIETLYIGKLREQGGRAIGKCPFHNEKSASFVIYLQQNRMYCFGCFARGDSIDFIRKQDNITFIEAVKKLINK